VLNLGRNEGRWGQWKCEGNCNGKWGRSRQESGSRMGRKGGPGEGGLSGSVKGILMGSGEEAAGE
jgi:hypothetical protein